MTLMAAYALGLGVPFVLAAIFVDRFIGASSRLRSMMPTIEKAMGGLLILVGILMLSGAFTSFSFWLLDAFPVLEKLG